MQAVVAGKEPRDCLKDLLAMLRSSAANMQVDTIARVMSKWAKDNGVVV